MKGFFLLFLLTPVSILAQINESDTLDFKIDLSINGFWQSGNVETKVFRAQSGLSFIPVEGLVFKTNNSYVYQEFGNQKADEDILSLNFLYLNPDRNIYPLVLGFVSTNYRREIDLRYLIGAGATFQVLNEKDYWLKFSLTSEYEKTNFRSTTFNKPDYNGNNVINTLRGTIWINGRYELFEKRVILNHESYFQPSLEDSGNYRWQADVGLEFPLWKFLNFTVNYTHAFESVVIQNQKQEDQFLTFGFTLKSY